MSGGDERIRGRAAGRDGGRGTSCPAARRPGSPSANDTDLINRFDIALQGAKATVVSFGARLASASRDCAAVARSLTARASSARDAQAAHLAAEAKPPR